MDDYFCLKAVHFRLSGSNINVWNMILFVPNAIFFLFLIWHLRPSLQQLRDAKSMIMNIYYGFVWIVVLASIFTCAIAMALPDNNLFVQILWLFLLCVHMFVELSVIVFLAHGSLRNSSEAIRITTVLTIFLALTYTAVQGILQFGYGWDIWARDGPAVLYWFARSAFFCLLYIAILLLPFTRWRHSLPLPAKTSFYNYVVFLLFLNFIQGAGCLIIYLAASFGYCLVDLAMLGYLAFFAPAVYLTFLRAFFANRTGAVYYDVIYAAYEEASLQGYSTLNDGQEEDARSLQSTQSINN